MKILITEKQLKKIKGEMEEALGVPEGILETGEEIYDLIIQELENFNGDIDDLTNDGFEINKDFKIADHTFNRVRVKFDVIEQGETKDADLHAMTSENESELDDMLVFKSVRDPQKIIIGFRFLIEPGKGVEEITDYLKKYRTEDIPSLTHELKHAFRDVKQKIESIPKRTDYVAIQSHGSLFGIIPEIRDFLFNSYYIHSIENVVRPTEFAAEMRMNNVSRKEFLNFFLNNEIIKKIKTIQNFSYDELKQNLHSKENIKKIKKLLKMLKIDFEVGNDDDIVGKFLRAFVVGFVNEKTDMMDNFLRTTFGEQIFGLKGPKKEFLEKYVNQMTKYGYDYDAYFKNEERYFHQVATMMLKKLSKLYDMAKSNPS